MKGLFAFVLVLTLSGIASTELGAFLASEEKTTLPNAIEVTVPVCRNACRFIIHRPIIKRKCLECCNTVPRNRARCIPVSPKIKFPPFAGKWDLRMKMLGKPLPFVLPRIEDGSGERKLKHI